MINIKSSLLRYVWYRPSYTFTRQVDTLLTLKAGSAGLNTVQIVFAGECHCAQSNILNKSKRLGFV